MHSPVAGQAPTAALLEILAAPYWQTIRAYPGNGGSCIVSRANPGANFSLLAAAALMIDYILNVAVGISAGIGALVSAAPSLHAYTLPLCLAGAIQIFTRSRGDHGDIGDVLCRESDQPSHTDNLCVRRVPREMICFGYIPSRSPVCRSAGQGRSRD